MARLSCRQPCSCQHPSEPELGQPVSNHNFVSPCLRVFCLRDGVDYALIIRWLAWLPADIVTTRTMLRLRNPFENVFLYLFDLIFVCLIFFAAYLLAFAVFLWIGARIPTFKLLLFDNNTYVHIRMYKQTHTYILAGSNEFQNNFTTLWLRRPQ